MKDNRLYVVIRNNLPCKCSSKGYMAAQGGHAIAEYLIEHKPHTNGEWRNNYLIVLQANERDFEKILWKLEQQNIKHSKFHEPDLDNKLTSIAVLNNCKLFKNLKLL